MAKQPLAPPDATDVFIREVDEELRRDQLANIWRQYGRTLLIGIGLFLVALAGVLFWRESQKEARQQLAARYIQALKLVDKQDSKAQAELHAIEKQGTPGYRALSRFAQATLAIKGGHMPDALKIYDAIIADTSVAAPFRDAARLKAVQLRFDAMSPAARIAALQPLAQPGGPWYGPAGELLAVSYLDNGQPALARALLDSIGKDESVLNTVRARATQMAAMLPSASPATATVSSVAQAGPQAGPKPPAPAPAPQVAAPATGAR